MQQNTVQEQSLSELLERLCNEGRPEDQAELGEIRGLYSAYEISGSVAVLEAIAVRLASRLLSQQACNTDVASLPRAAMAAPPIAPKRKRNIYRDEWVEGFVHLIGGDFKESTIGGYVRAIKRVIKDKDNNLADVTELVDRIDEMIAKYEGNDTKYHNMHICALRVFRDYCLDHHGFLIALESEGVEEIIWRCYCVLDDALDEYKRTVEEYSDRKEINVILRDKFGRLIKDSV